MWLFGWKQPGALCSLPPVATWKNKLFVCLIFYVDGHQSGLIVFLFRWSWKLSPCLVMRSSWVVQGKHTFLFTSISNSVDDLLFVNFDLTATVSVSSNWYILLHRSLRTAFLWIDIPFTSPGQNSPTSQCRLSRCHRVRPFQVMIWCQFLRQVLK